ncbi:DUF1803 domain-containing protein, partial [Mycobacterium tuberculosis]|nr:DUF1803 domain-containing protein [Mycobacterium tuberculosis]
RLTRQPFFKDLINFLDQHDDVILRQIKAQFPDQPVESLGLDHLREVVCEDSLGLAEEFEAAFDTSAIFQGLDQLFGSARRCDPAANQGPISRS